MADEKKSKMSERFAGLRTEFSKIVWPTGETVYKKSLATIIVSVILGLIIVAIDMFVQYGVDFLLKL